MEKYFLDKAGVKTKRMSGRPGQAHIEIANHVLANHGVAVEEVADVFGRMFEFGYARVAETGDQVEVESPNRLSKKQSAFLAAKEREGKRVIINAGAFIATKGRCEPTQ